MTHVLEGASDSGGRGSRIRGPGGPSRRALFVCPTPPGRDTADAWLLEQGLTSRIHVLMKRRNLSRDEAIAELKQIGADRRIEAEALGLPAPGEEPQQPAGANGAAGGETEPAGTTDAGDSD